jgi:hypothetical protein
LKYLYEPPINEAMYIESVPNRDSPPAILLRESYREDGKVRKRTLANLSCLPTEVRISEHRDRPFRHRDRRIRHRDRPFR